MKNLKFFKNFNLDFFIIITIMIVSMTGFNVLFNVFFNAYNVTRQNKNFIEKNNHIDISFKEELDSVRAKEFLKRINAKGIEFATEKEVTLTGGFFDKRLNLNLVSDKNIFDYKVHKGKDLIDIKDDEKGIIIPELYKELVYEEENNYFINIKNEKFKVLGVIDNRFSEDYYSYRAFIPYDSSESFFDENLSGITITSSNSKEELEHIIKADEAVKEIGFISPSYITVDAQLETVKEELNYYIFIGILCFINFILFLVFYLKKQDKKVGVLRAVGFNKKMVTKYFQKQILILGIVASFMAWALYYPFANFFNNSFMNLGLMPSELILLVDLIIVFALIIITYRINFFVLNNKNINNTIVSNKNILNGVMIKMLLIVQIALMFNYSFDANDIYADINKILNKAKNVVDLENTLVVNPFTVPLSDEVLTNTNVEEIEKSLQDKNIDFITYFYSLDYSNAALGLNNIQELIDTLAIDSNITGYDLNDKEIPILHIDRASLDELNIKTSIIKESSDKASTPVIAGYNYANKFKVGDKVLGESGVSYEIIGFLNKNENMFMTNSGTQIMSEFNNLDSFFINVEDLDKLHNVQIDSVTLKMERLWNFLVKYKSDEDKVFIQKVFAKEDISLVELERQLERYKYINFNYLKYKLFNSLIISIISFIGIICYVLFSVFSNRKIIGIKRALGYTRIKLLSEYVINVFLILTAGIVIVLGHKHKDELFKLSSDNIVLITLVVALVIASTIGIVLHYITKRNIADFVKGD